MYPCRIPTTVELTKTKIMQFLKVARYTPSKTSMESINMLKKHTPPCPHTHRLTGALFSVAIVYPHDLGISLLAWGCPVIIISCRRSHGGI